MSIDEESVLQDKDPAQRAVEQLDDDGFDGEDFKSSD